MEYNSLCFIQIHFQKQNIEKIHYKKCVSLWGIYGSLFPPQNKKNVTFYLTIVSLDLKIHFFI